MKLPKLLIAASIFCALALSSCKSSLGSYVDPLYLEDSNEEASVKADKK